MIAPGIFTGNVLEKTPQPPKQMRALGPVTGFPTAPPRPKAKLAAITEATDQKITVPITISSAASVSFPGTPSAGQISHDSGEEDRPMDTFAIDNVQAILAMSPEQMQEALSEISSMFSGKSIDFLRHRALKDAKSRAMFGETDHSTSSMCEYMEPGTCIIDELSSSCAVSARSSNGKDSVVPIIPSTLEELEIAKRTAGSDILANLAWTIDDVDDDVLHTNHDVEISDKHNKSELNSNSSSTMTSSDQAQQPKMRRGTKGSIDTKTAPHPFPLARLSKDRFDLQGRKVFESRAIAVHNVLGALSASPLLESFMSIADLSHLAERTVDGLKAVGAWTEPTHTNSLQPQDELLHHQYDRDVPGYSFVEIGEVRKRTILTLKYFDLAHTNICSSVSICAIHTDDEVIRPETTTACC